MTYQTKTIAYDTRVRTFWTLAAFCIIFAAVYIFSIHLTIRNTATRQSLTAQAAELSARQSSLEFAYINKKNEISIEMARAHGYREVSSPTYISRTQAGSLTYNR